MNVTAKTIYCILAVIELSKAGKNTFVKATSISEKYDIPKRFLEISLSELKLSKIVDSKKGAGGGFYLIKSPSEISIYDIIKITESEKEVFNWKKYLTDNNYPITLVFDKLNSEIVDILKSITFDKILKVMEDNQKIINFVI
jgi:Rrf2 family protein